MPSKDHDLHGNAPDRAPVALMIIDMINDLEWDGGKEILPHALGAAERIALLKQRAHGLGIPVIYANDNFGRWRSDFHEVVDHCLSSGSRGKRLAELLRPGKDDYFVLKPKHSAFFATTLETLLKYLGTQRLILTGIAGDVCVLISAIDAYMRDFTINVPVDCVASASVAENDKVLAYMERVLHAELTAAAEIDLQRLVVE